MTDMDNVGTMPDRGRRRDPQNGLTAGVVMITVGAIFLVEQAHLVDGWHFNRLWPLILIVTGLANLFGRRACNRGWGGLWLVLVGVMFLLHENRVLLLDQTWPLFIVAGGLAMLFGARRDRSRSESARPDVWGSGGSDSGSGGTHV